jgi:DNA-binding NtrC family response regulator
LTPQSTGQNRVVLIIEDDSVIAYDIAAAFSDAGWQVREAESATEALALLSAGDPIDALFTDIDLDGPATGWDVAEAFRAAHPQLAVMYTSGISRTHCRAVDGSLFFAKPYDAAEIIGACRNLLRNPAGSQASN